MEIEQLVESMDSTTLLENLKTLIDQTYIIEQDFNSLRQTFDDVIEMQSNALWILDQQGDIYLQNTKAQKRSALFETLHFNEREYEKTFNERSYLIKINETPDKKKVISATDITEQKRKESLAIMGQMAAHLSHEIRNPIGSISILTSSLLRRAKLENKPIIFEIQKAIFRIERIIKSTLMFSKGVEAQKSLMNFRDLGAELESAISYYSYSKDITFNFDFPDLDIQADFDLLLMVFSNFVFNAIDAIEEHEIEEGKVDIIFSQTENEFYFQILDSGVGFSDITHLFQAFHSSKEKGNGLGLVLSKEIVQCHKGTINIIDEVNRKGFELTLAKE